MGGRGSLYVGKASRGGGLERQRAAQMEALRDLAALVRMLARRNRPKLSRRQHAQIPVSVVLDQLVAGETLERILVQYPSLAREHIPAALGYASDLARERVVPMPV